MRSQLLLEDPVDDRIICYNLVNTWERIDYHHNYIIMIMEAIIVSLSLGFSLIPTCESFSTFVPSAASAQWKTLSLSSTTQINLHNHHGEHAELMENHIFHPISGIIDQLGMTSIVESPVFWTSTIMVCITFLLYAWEKTISSARANLPECLQPIVNSMLEEMGSLGFIGLFLSLVVVQGPFGGVVGATSEVFLGNEEILLEAFEFLHTSFFEVGVSFFVITGLTVLGCARQVESLEIVSRAYFDLNQDGEVELSEIAEVLNVDSYVVDSNQDGILSQQELCEASRRIPLPTLASELFQSKQVACEEAFLVRERILETQGISDEVFQMETYFVRIFGRNLEEMVELSPLVWLPFIPVVAYGTSIDLEHEIVSAGSPNAFVTCGSFIASTDHLVVTTFVALLSVAWGVWNLSKMVQIKSFLIPILVRDSNQDGAAVLLPPRYEDEVQMKAFNSSPFPVNMVEGFFGKPARNNQESLFGAAGNGGPDLYRNSIKLQAFFATAQLVFLGSQIVARDISALVQGVPETVGRPDLLLPELELYGSLCLLALGQLWLVPKTFLDFSLVTSIEKLLSEDLFTEACKLDDSRKSGVLSVEEQLLLQSSNSTLTIPANTTGAVTSVL